MVSHDLKTIFIHIPKCAGTSIEHVLGHHADFSGYGRQDHRSIRRLKPSSNPLRGSAERLFGRMRYLSRLIALRAGVPYRNPRNVLSVTPRQFDDYFKFSFVRNPWDRAHSIYRKLMAGEWKTGEFGIDAPMEFDAFLERFAGGWMMLQQTDYICDSDGTLMMDFIGRYENLDEDFAEVCNRLGIDRIKLPRHIQGPGGKSYQEAYSEFGRDLVARVYRTEIDLFGYEFE